MASSVAVSHEEMRGRRRRCQNHGKTGKKREERGAGRRNNAGIIVCVIVMAGHIMTTDNGWGVPVAAAAAGALAVTHTTNRREKVLKRPGDKCRWAKRCLFGCEFMKVSKKSFMNICSEISDIGA